MKSSLLAALVLCAAASLTAQPATPPTAQQRAAFEARRMDRLATLLDLNDGQRAQVQTILQEAHAQGMQALEQAPASGTRPTREQMKAAHAQMKAETEQKLSTVLTPSQLKKFQLLEEDGPRHGPRWRDGPHGPPPAAPAGTPSPQN